MWGDTLPSTRLPPHYSHLTAKDGGCPFNPRHYCDHGIHLREYGGASQEKQVGEPTTTSVPDAVVAVRITEVISRL